MEYKWLSRKNESKIIIFFNGWGMDENIVSNLSAENFDILMFYDYNTLLTDFDFNLLKEYNERFLIAWSMGVMTATLFKNKLGSLQKTTAINGTLKPIDDNYGIPIKIYDITAKLYNEQVAAKFIENMGLKNIKAENITKRTTENQKSELIALKNYNADNSFKYTKILISDNDKIIPTKNQSAYWKISPNISGEHYIFNKFSSWSELL